MVTTDGNEDGEHGMHALAKDIDLVPETLAFGRVAGIQGMLVEVVGPLERMHIGTRLKIRDGLRHSMQCEVVGFRGNRAIALPLGALDGVRMGCQAEIVAGETALRPGEGWLGRIVNAQGEPIDGKGPLPAGPVLQPLRNQPPPAHRRSRVGGPIDLGVKALNTFATCCLGQRLGIFAGSGVGKSVLFSMLARNTASDVSVVALIGERGREVQEFLEDDLGPDGLAKSVVVVATSDEPALMRRQAAYTAMAIAEHFRDRDRNVLLLMDSLTRFAMAQREIGLAGGEPPTTRGYTPTVFSELPRLLERAGPGAGAGSITGLFTVLVEGDDHNEPISDTVRSIVDGHIVMERAIAERGRYPAINVLKSVSRTMPGAADPEFLADIQRAKALMSTFADMEELIRLGAYRKGSDPAVDEAIALNAPLEAFLGQDKRQAVSIDEGYRALRAILEGSAAAD